MARRSSTASGGPLSVNDPRSPRPVSERFLNAAANAGIAREADYNDGELGGLLVQVTQRNGRRWSTADAFLRPARKRANLTVFTGAHALRRRAREGRASGVLFSAGGYPLTVHAEREVIIAAGALGRPSC